MKHLIISFVCLFGVVLAVDKLSGIPLKDFYARSNDTRIIGGSPATSGQFPWQVFVGGMLPDGTTSVCGGSLIDDSNVLTAAHCVTGAAFFVLFFGGLTINPNEVNRLTVIANRSIVHPNYNSNLLNNDVALIQLNAPIIFNSNIQPVRLPSRGDRIGAGVEVAVSGWGRTSDISGPSNVLNWVNLRTISNDQCRQVFADGIIIDSTLCAVGNPHHSTCNGDSGGPLVLISAGGIATHHGIVSFVSSNGCATGFPSGYVRTESMLNWIYSEINSGYVNRLFISKFLLLILVPLFKIIL